MIVNLTDTTTHDISEKLDQMHEERGETTSGRVLTLLITCLPTELDESVHTASAASREHPCRIIALVKGAGAVEAAESRLDAEIRTGTDAGAGEVIILRPFGELTGHLDTLVIPLMVPDTPAVAWWPTTPPLNPSKDPIGAMASSRLTDASRTPDPQRTFELLRKSATPDDVDLSWTRLTVWRAMLASMLDQPPHEPITSAQVSGEPGNLSVWLLAAWLHVQLGVPVGIEWDSAATAVRGVKMYRSDGELSFDRPCEDQAVVSVPGEAPQQISVPMRTLVECMSEELRRLNPDEVYVKVIHSDFDFTETFVDE
ncbi:MAG: glucose-6-phosphate dehydrogenase assembly protein OpcA [Bifidobacteriaceae bacterium]|jgi:glucose-6-phosphate dehydrogenase assembly protein OpcA|nr:glucose-6-phosphate dehydrogenase assembly protein OpcA [Bifidobacteriaceae bacterium]